MYDYTRFPFDGANKRDIRLELKNMILKIYIKLYLKLEKRINKITEKWSFFDDRTLV